MQEDTETARMTAKDVLIEGQEAPTKIRRQV